MSAVWDNACAPATWDLFLAVDSGTKRRFGLEGKPTDVEMAGTLDVGPIDFNSLLSDPEGLLLRDFSVMLGKGFFTLVHISGPSESFS